MLQQLTKDFPENKRCVRCDIILSASNYNGKKIASKISKVYSDKPRFGNFMCIKCSMSPTRKKGLIKISEKDVEVFLAQ